MHKQKGMNKHQKRAFRPGEHRTRAPQIEQLLELACSFDPVDRAEAAQNLCPCHVRRRIDEVWQALYGLMEDPDVRVRRAAWHTLEDGGRPDDPAFEQILARARMRESDPQICRLIEKFASVLDAQAEIALARAASSRFALRGRCDFCGTENIAVRRDVETEIVVAGQTRRLAHICAQCEQI